MDKISKYIWEEYSSNMKDDLLRELDFVWEKYNEINNFDYTPDEYTKLIKYIENRFKCITDQVRDISNPLHPPPLYQILRDDFKPLNNIEHGVFFSTNKHVANSYIKCPHIEANVFNGSTIREYDIIDIETGDGSFDKSDFDKKVKNNPSKVIRAKDVLNNNLWKSNKQCDEIYKCDIYGSLRTDLFKKGAYNYK